MIRYICNQSKQKEEKVIEKYIELGKINIKLLKKYFNIKTDELIITKERINHINKRHNNDYNRYGKYIQDIIENPDYILIDKENKDTVLYLKSIEKLNFQVIVKIYNGTNKFKSNSIITFWHMRNRSYNQIILKNKKIFENIDINE